MVHGRKYQIPHPLPAAPGTRAGIRGRSCRDRRIGMHMGSREKRYRNHSREGCPPRLCPTRPDLRSCTTRLSPQTPQRLRSPPPFGTSLFAFAPYTLAHVRSPLALLASNPAEAAPRSSFFFSLNLLHRLRNPSRPTSTSTFTAPDFSPTKPTSRNSSSSLPPPPTKNGALLGAEKLAGEGECTQLTAPTWSRRRVR
uniref:Uncharacterized protein n=1 Tax=Ananas comosus var. bracteatus TaxID=296719 RepID=A0A6V7NQP1_ANACO|nr:unnamed protein product [Ananas comosus var. bracteatus]